MNRKILSKLNKSTVRPSCFLEKNSIRATSYNLMRYFQLINNYQTTYSIDNASYVFVDIEYYQDIIDLKKKYKFGVNRLPKVSQLLDKKDKYYSLFIDNIPKTYIDDTSGQDLTGYWVQKKIHVDKGEGILFLKNPGKWENPGHVLQKKIEIPDSLLKLTNNRVFDIRLMVLIYENGDYKVYQDGLLRCAYQPYTKGSLDLLENNSNIAFQQKFYGIKNCDRALLSSCGEKFKDYMNQINKIVARDIDILKELHVFNTSSTLEKDRPLDFELFGYDLMIDLDDTVYVIEVNDNPGCPMWTAIDRDFYMNAFNYFWR